MQRSPTVQYEISQSFKKPLYLPDLSLFKVADEDMVIAGTNISFTKSKSLLFEKHSKLLETPMMVTTYGYLIVYQEKNRGFVLDLSTVKSITSGTVVPKKNSLARLSTHMKLKFPFGSLHIFLRNERMEEWRAVLTTICERGVQAIVKNKDKGAQRREAPVDSELETIYESDLTYGEQTQTSAFERAAVVEKPPREEEKKPVIVEKKETQRDKEKAQSYNAKEESMTVIEPICYNSASDDTIDSKDNICGIVNKKDHRVVTGPTRTLEFRAINSESNHSTYSIHSIRTGRLSVANIRGIYEKMMGSEMDIVGEEGSRRHTMVPSQYGISSISMPRSSIMGSERMSAYSKRQTMVPSQLGFASHSLPRPPLACPRPPSAPRRSLSAQSLVASPYTQLSPPTHYLASSRTSQRSLSESSITNEEKETFPLPPVPQSSPPSEREKAGKCIIVEPEYDSCFDSIRA